MRLEVLTSTDELEGLREPWARLAKAGGTGALFRGPDWLLAWWHAYREALHAEAWTLALYDGDQLVCLAPLYRRTTERLRIHEIRLMGDAGPRPPALDFLVERGYDQRAARLIADELDKNNASWDVIDLEPLQDPSPLRAFLVQSLTSRGKRVDTYETGGAQRMALDAHGADPAEKLRTTRALRVYDKDEAAVRKGLAALRRLSRLEWADRDEASPIAEPETTRLLTDVVTSMPGQARLARIDDRSGEAAAAALVLDDDDRAVVLALAVDPEQDVDSLAPRLIDAEARAAHERGKVALDIVVGAGEHSSPHLPATRQRALRLRVFNNSASASIARTYGAVRRRVDAAREAPQTASASARYAWSRIRSAAANVAAYGRLLLYRGELWTRGVTPAEGLVLATFSESDFDALSAADRDDLVEELHLDVSYCHDKWRRGDTVILARIEGRPAGIAWCARTAVHVPELDREVRPGVGECYIHDVFVSPWARGRRVAPSMLEGVAQELRQRDVYRSWALIGPDNVASIRAFEKAAYAPVADVVFARMASVGRVTVRPPDPEAKHLLGL